MHQPQEERKTRIGKDTERGESWTAPAGAPWRAGSSQREEGEASHDREGEGEEQEGERGRGKAAWRCCSGGEGRVD
jgi:hypothetical protein